MRKSILIIGFFLVIATVALVYAVQSLESGAIPLTIKRFIPSLDPPAVSVLPATSESNVLFDWKLGNPYLLKGGDGNVFLDLRVTGKNQADVKRKPLNLVLVIDRSGSMGSENKLEEVKNAATAIVNQMDVRDRLGIVIYDDAIQTLIPSSPVENKERVRELIYSLTPGGSTNLFGGLLEGGREIRKHFRPDCVNRIILLSDGLANVGVTDPEQIAAEARRLRANSVSISAMGVGIDYNESLMANIADHSGGNYYFISKEVNMAEIFRREWNLMQNMVATDAKATMHLGNGVEVVDVAGFKWSRQGRALTIQIPDIYSGETKRVLVELRAAANAVKTIDLGQGQFFCSEISSGKPKNIVKDFHPTIQVVEDQRLVRSNLDDEVNAKAVSNQASRSMRDAYDRWQAGEIGQARKLANETVDGLKALGYTATAPQESRYENFLKVLMDPAAEAPPPEMIKEEVKKQKEADRQSEQNSPQ
ncbi:MAG TPA: VWA domain-containing protein [Acidobacteriota bacterium]|nr:VWA domain-containing protein [Acidobacteriota bacterium]